mgnify:CR=1 FL=1
MIEMGSQSADAVAQAALSAFDHVVGASHGFKTRTGQRAMAQRIAEKLALVDLGSHPDPGKAIAVIQAGTGVGKSAAYLATAIAMALRLKTRLVVSTATVALQEQLMHKDLPAMASALGQPFTFALAKGRGRYVCKLKLERFAVQGAAQDGDLLEVEDEAHAGQGQAGTTYPDRQDPFERRVKLYASLSDALRTRVWDGDRDALPEPPESLDWSAVAADRHTCTGRHCPVFRDCSYFQARAQLTQVQVIVANHDLVLASLGRNALPELDNCLWVFDEAHHLPDVALERFSSSMDLTSLRWLDKLPKTLQEVAEKISMPLPHDLESLCAQLKVALLDLGRICMDSARGHNGVEDAVHRFSHGQLPEQMIAPMGLVHGQALALSDVLQALGAEVKLRAKEEPAQAAALAFQYARLGQLAPRLSSVLDTSAMLLSHEAQPLAKWLKVDTGSGLVGLSLQACPLVPGALLEHHLWSRVRAAILTSASLTSCGSFDFFLKETGLDQIEQVSTLAVESPFDYRRQGQLLVVETLADPRQVDAYTQEMLQALQGDLRQIVHGALVLFTSKVQLYAAVDALTADLRARVLVQGHSSRSKLLATHRARVESGQASILFGLRSFGEGVDLPGKLCETVLIAKLPFASPSEPVAQARAEWLKREGRDPFDELVVPATGMRLLQWTGRAIRTEEDVARVICYDKRLLSMAFGRRILKGLPPYELLRRRQGEILALKE